MKIGLLASGNNGSYALRIEYRLAPSGWGGVAQGYEQPQDWSAYDGFSFQFDGSNTGNPIRLELLGERSACSPADTSERFVYQFKDNFTGWKTFTLPWNAFTRRSDWQPDGAPNNDLDLTQIWGFNLSPIAGSGSFQISDIQLIKGNPAAGDNGSPTRFGLNLYP